MQKHRLLMLVVPFLVAALLRGQTTSLPSSTAPASSRQSSNMPKFPGDMDEPDPFRENSRHRARETERQKRIVDDANRLVKLTAQYRSDVEQHGTVTAEDQKLLLQIEKLAREVKDRMKGM